MDTTIPLESTMDPRQPRPDRSPDQGSGPYATLGLPRRFALHDAEIQRAYLAAAASVHPDLASGDPEAPARAAALNAARDTLADPERRATALLHLLGGPSAAEDKSLPDGFLIDMLEVREQVEASRGDAEATARWERWADEQRDAFIQRVAALFEGAANDPARRAAIRRELNAWRYIERLIEQLDPDYDPASADFA